jgi:hypothetical protein
MALGSVFSLSIIQNSLRTICWFFFKCWYNSAVNTSSSGLFFGRLYYYFNLIVIVLFELFIPSLFNFYGLYVSGSISIFSRFSNLLEYKSSKYSLMITWILLVSVVLSQFSTLVLLIWVFFLFLLVSLGVC